MLWQSTGHSLTSLSLWRVQLAAHHSVANLFPSAVAACGTKATRTKAKAELSTAPALQLAAHHAIADVFSLCFGSVEGNGALLLGDVALHPAQGALEYTPLLHSETHPHYYLVDLQGLSVGTAMLDLPAVSAPPRLSV